MSNTYRAVVEERTKYRAKNTETKRPANQKITLQDAEEMVEEEFKVLEEEVSHEIPEWYTETLTGQGLDHLEDDNEQLDEGYEDLEYNEDLYNDDLLRQYSRDCANG